jgi:hypothetical protein
MRSQKARKDKTEYWIFESGVLVRADGRPIILKSRNTAERFIAEMGMDCAWEIKEAVAPVRETRGRKAKKDKGWSRALLSWAMMKPGKRPTRFDDQRAFVEKFSRPLAGNPMQKRKAVRAFIKQVRRLHRSAQASASIDKLLSA